MTIRMKQKHFVANPPLTGESNGVPVLVEHVLVFDKEKDGECDKDGTIQGAVGRLTLETIAGRRIAIIAENASNVGNWYVIAPNYENGDEREYDIFIDGKSREDKVNGKLYRPEDVLEVRTNLGESVIVQWEPHSNGVERG